jgi:prophage regulatory protein
MTTETTAAPASLPATGFIRQKQLAAIIPFSRTTLWRKVRDGEFPAPERLSLGITAWKVELVRQWIAEHSSAEQPQAE